MSDVHAVSVQALEATFRIQHLITHVNHQHIFRPLWFVEDIVVPHNSEVFVCRLPRNVIEGELVPLFSRYGQIFEMRLMMSVTGGTRGYCYVTYTHKNMAMNAIRALHGYQLRPNTLPIACYPSFNNRRLFFEGLPLDQDPTMVENAIRMQVPGVIDVVMLDPNPGNSTYAVGFVEFFTHTLATNCLKEYFPNKLHVCGRPVNMEFSVPSPPHDTNNILMIKDLPWNLTRVDMLASLTTILPESIRITKAFKSGRYAILRFGSDVEALRARDIINEQGVRGPVETKLFDFDAFGEIELLWSLQTLRRQNIRIPYRWFVADY